MIPYIPEKIKGLSENIQEIMENNSEDTLNGIIDYTHIWNDYVICYMRLIVIMNPLVMIITIIL